MAEKIIAIGEGNSTTELGIAPPLTDAEAQALLEQLENTGVLESISSSCCIQQITSHDNPHVTRDYTEVSFDSGDLCRIEGDYYLNTVSRLARAAVQYLVRTGYTVKPIPHITPTNYDVPVFSESADAQRENSTQLKSSKRRLVL